MTPARVARGRLAAGFVGAALALACGDPPPATRAPQARLPQGLVFGDVQANEARIWARAEGASALSLEIVPDTGGAPARRFHAALDPARDSTARLVVSGLAPATRYRVRATAQDGPVGGAFAEGRFRTAPDPSAPEPLRVVFGGDLAGQNVCRDAREGFPIFRAVRDLDPDLFIGLGDMIYADDVCDATGRYGNAQLPGGFGPAVDRPGFWAHWRYAREDPGLRGLLSETPYVAVWDDHEIVNDAGPAQDVRDVAPYTPEVKLLPLARRAFLDWNPLMQPPEEPETLHRALRYGRHLELFVLDTRSVRDPNLLADDPERPKSMLGTAQRTWLEAALPASDATWKVVVSSVPISIPTGSAASGRDGWAGFDLPSGFARELAGILRTFAERRVRNLVFLTTDVHFAAAFRYVPFPDRPNFELYELVTGPMNAGLFPNPAFDTSLGATRLFYFGPASPDAVKTFEGAKRWFNFGLLEFDAEGGLRLEVRDTGGATVYALDLSPR